MGFAYKTKPKQLILEVVGIDWVDKVDKYRKIALS